MTKWDVKQALRLYLVTDHTWLNGRTLLQVIEEALKGGVTMVQLREKHVQQRELITLGKQMLELTKAYHVPLIINDDVQAALEIGADGVHVGQKDTCLQEARRVLGADCIVGVTCNRVDLAQTACAGGADYLGVGAVFGSSTKLDAKPLDHAILREICKVSTVPVTAIGGINLNNVSQLAGNGIDGVAVISGILAQPNIEETARQFQLKLHDIVEVTA